MPEARAAVGAPTLARGDRDLVLALRAELAAILPARPCDRGAELAGLLAVDPGGSPPIDPHPMVARQRPNPVEVTPQSGRASHEPAATRGPSRDHGALPARLRRDPGLARLVLRLRREAQPAATAGRRQGPGGSEGARLGGGGEGFQPPWAQLPTAFSWAGAPDHCRTAYLRGLFLGHGSLSIAGGRTHLELVLDGAAADRLRPLLAELGWPAGIRIRRGRGVLTWKSSEVVGLFLRRIGATSTLLELEARGAIRALRGDLNRVLNAESANLSRMVEAASRQTMAIRRLRAMGQLATLDETLQRVAAARLAAPEATLSELAAELGVHRSLVQRALRRLEELAREAEEGRDSPAAAPTPPAGRPSSLPPSHLA
jgi:hypothetical protein